MLKMTPEVQRRVAGQGSAPTALIAEASCLGSRRPGCLEQNPRNANSSRRCTGGAGTGFDGHAVWTSGGRKSVGSGRKRGSRPGLQSPGQARYTRITLCETVNALTVSGATVWIWSQFWSGPGASHSRGAKRREKLLRRTKRICAPGSEFFGTEGLDRQGVDIGLHQVADCLEYQPVPGDPR